MEILGIMGSPRRNGNTDILLSWALAGAEQAGATTKIIQLKELTINECDGCLACWKNAPCPKQDDMNPLYEKITASDAYIFATPVYWYGPTALMKGFIDRWVYFNAPDNRTKIRGKSAALLVPYEETDPINGEAVSQFFQRSLSYLEMKLIGELLVGDVGPKGAVKAIPELELAARRLGERLAKGQN